MGVSEFFRSFFPITDVNELREEIFSLYYFSEGGFTYSDVEDLEYEERQWHIKRIYEQKKKENKSIKDSQGGIKKYRGKRSNRMRRRR